MKLKHLYLFLVSVALATLTGCGGLFGDPDTPGTNVTPADIMGTYTAETNPQDHWVYSSDAAEESGYYWGKCWDESQDVQESDLVFHGNGWFKWMVEEDKLTLIHQTDIGSAAIPKRYTIVSCDKRALELRDNYGTIKKYIRK